jgi:8-oxo-dGTP diphosphatase
MRGKIGYTNIGFELLEERFTLRDLQEVYEQILGRKLDGPNFRKKMLKSGLLVESPGLKGGAGRPARMFGFKGNSNVNPFSGDQQSTTPA